MERGHNKVETRRSRVVNKAWSKNKADASAHVQKDVLLETPSNLWTKMIKNAPNLPMRSCSTTRKKNKTPLKEQ
jgi:hypothetical protein